MIKGRDGRGSLRCMCRLYSWEQRAAGVAVWERALCPASFRGDADGTAAPMPSAAWWLRQQLKIKAISLVRGVSQLSERLERLKRADDWQERTQPLLRREGPLKSNVALSRGMETQRFPLLPRDWRLTPHNVFCKIRIWKGITDHHCWHFEALFILPFLLLWQVLVYTFEVLLSAYVDPVLKHY